MTVQLVTRAGQQMATLTLLFGLFVGGPVLGLMAVAAAAAGAGSVALGFGWLAFGGSVLLAFRWRLRRRSRAITEELDTIGGGTGLRYTRAEIPVAMMMSLSIPVVVAAAAVIGVPYPFTWIFLVLVPVALLHALFVYAMSRGQIGRGYLTMTPTLVVHRGWGFTSTLPWVDVVDIQTVDDLHPRDAADDPHRPARKIRIIGAPGRRTVEWHTRLLQVDHPAWPLSVVTDGPDGFPTHVTLDNVSMNRFWVRSETIGQLMRFYLDNPDRRIELGTPHALARAQSLRRAAWRRPAGPES